MADGAARRWPAVDIDAGLWSALPATFGDRLALLLHDLDEVLAVEEEGGTHWRVFFSTPAARDAAVAALAPVLRDEAAVAPVDVEDEGWAAKVQATLGPVRVGRFVVTPPWAAGEACALGWNVPDPAVPQAEARLDRAARPLVIEIEPSTGFGTGHHQSTRLCLRALEATRLDGRTVIDVGTGSGVLAIAAVAAGAAGAVALDHDPDAVSAARDNVARNLVGDRVTTLVGGLSSLSTPPAGVVLANLTANILRRFGAAIAALVAPEGVLIVSGFTTEQVPLVTETFAAHGLGEDARWDEDDWVALRFARAPGDQRVRGRSG